MLSNAVLLSIRFFAFLLLLMGTVLFVGHIFLLLDNENFRGVFDQGGSALLVWLSQLLPIFFMTPLLVVLAGAVLFVLAEIALRMERPRDKVT